jgi:hypothetical protein
LQAKRQVVQAHGLVERRHRQADDPPLCRRLANP